jgi:hypothetical protein
MRLSDHFLAAQGTPEDVGFATTMSKVIVQAERFEIHDEVARACGSLVSSRPSTLVAALPMCRLPYENVWMEWRGGLGKVRPGDRNAPIPEKQGVLIQSNQGQVGFMTWGWVHSAKALIGSDVREQDIPAHAVNISPISIYFDWREGHDVRNTVRSMHKVILEKIPTHVRNWLEVYMEYMERRWNRQTDIDVISHTFMGNSSWKHFVGNKAEIVAIQKMGRHLSPGMSPHGVVMAAYVLSHVQDEGEMRKFMLAWEADIQGEAMWVECFLAMLNSRNPVVEHEAADLTKLNKARVKRGKREFLGYKKTRLAMSRSQKRMADAKGVDREVARQHLVRGHFKIRKTGVYWWSPFLRGDALRGVVKREIYDVV